MENARLCPSRKRHIRKIIIGIKEKIMSVDYSYFQESKDLKLVVECLKFNAEFRKLHPNYFYPEGITIFSGSQRRW